MTVFQPTGEMIDTTFDLGVCDKNAKSEEVININDRALKLLISLYMIVYYYGVGWFWIRLVTKSLLITMLSRTIPGHANRKPEL